MADVLPRAFGKYILERRLGVGGMAETFVARREGEGNVRQHVCLKRVLPAFNGDASFRAQFQREAKLAARLRHSNIVGTIDYGAVDSVQYMALELVEGTDLRALLSHQPERRLPVPLVLLLAYDIAHALEYAHEPRGGGDGIVHRDVTPSNILLSVEGAVKLADFGVAKSLGTATAMTATGVMKGKMPYMPPEQMKGGEVDGRVDLFSLGVLMYEALAGRRPFTGAHDVEVMTRIISGDRPTLKSLMPHLDDALAAVVEDLLAIEPEARTPSAAALIDRLAPFVPPPSFRRDLAQLVRAAYGSEAHPGEASDTVLDEAHELAGLQGSSPSGASAPTAGPKRRAPKAPARPSRPTVREVQSSSSAPTPAPENNQPSTRVGYGLEAGAAPEVVTNDEPGASTTRIGRADPVADGADSKFGTVASTSPGSESGTSESGATESSAAENRAPGNSAAEGSATDRGASERGVSEAQETAPAALLAGEAREHTATAVVARPAKRGFAVAGVVLVLLGAVGAYAAFGPSTESPPDLAAPGATPASAGEQVQPADESQPAVPGEALPVGASPPEPEPQGTTNDETEPTEARTEADSEPNDEPEGPAEPREVSATAMATREGSVASMASSEGDESSMAPDARTDGSMREPSAAAGAGEQSAAAMTPDADDAEMRPARRSRGTITVAPWGEVWIDGRYMGRAPVNARLTPG
ncbi:MAG: protein kinase, partial [Myxococcota bacterium]